MNRCLMRAAYIREIFFPNGNVGLKEYTDKIHGDWYILKKEVYSVDGFEGYKVTIVSQYNGTPIWKEQL